jgi:hypothetical protein
MFTNSSSLTPHRPLQGPLANAPIAIEKMEELAVRMQVSRAVERLSRDGHTSTDPNEDRVHVRLGVPLPVQVEAKHDCIHMRADWERMNWGTYTAIAQGLRKLVAGDLQIEADALKLNKLLIVDGDRAVQYVEIVVPKNHAPRFTSAETRANFKNFLTVVTGEPLSDATQGDPSLAIECAREVRAAVGGKTLPAACFIQASGWEAPLALSGRLGAKPPAAASTREELTIECRVDGYIKSQRLVHLLPVSTSNERGKARNDGRRMVAYDEAIWFKTIASLASEPGQLVRATYEQVFDGMKERLKLTNLEPIAGDENHTE